MKRKLIKLGRCPHCKKPVSRRSKRSWCGEKIPQFVYITSKDVYYHRHCWKEVEKSRARRIRLNVETPSTLLGKISVSKENY
ncbi:MAG: hypothetical protein ISS36_02670 [Candidatus Aenigmarchaeota archaeon]|nr:hypothetical protein [Candidatus Aenigmarchaeota archaeon]